MTFELDKAFEKDDVQLLKSLYNSELSEDSRYLSRCLASKPKAHFRGRLDCHKDIDYGYRLLHSAVLSDAYSCVEFLISVGSDLTAKSNEGFTPLHLAIMAGSERIFEILVRSGALEGMDEARRASVVFALGAANFTNSNPKKMIKCLAQHGMSLSVKNKSGWPLPHFIVVNGNSKTLEYVVDALDDVNISDNEGRTALDIAQIELGDMIGTSNANPEFVEDLKAKESVLMGYGVVNGSKSRANYNYSTLVELRED